MWDWFIAYVVPGPVYRFCRRTTRWLKHPRREWEYRRFLKNQPGVGEYVLYHNEGPYRVTHVNGDMLTIEINGTRDVVSYSACCDPVS